MPSLAVVEQRARLQVIDGGLSPKRGRPSAADDLRLEMVARRSEEQSLDAQMAPLLSRVLMRARSDGPVMYRTAAAIAYLMGRHKARWSDDPETAA